MNSLLIHRMNLRELYIYKYNDSINLSIVKFYQFNFSLELKCNITNSTTSLI